MQLRTPTHIEVVQNLGAAEFHWHLCQGIVALNKRLYIPGCISIISGIEASLQHTLLKNRGLDPKVGDLGTTLSNRLLREARNIGMPVEVLAFPNERDFGRKIASKSPEAEIVRVRNNLAHGNVIEYVTNTPETGACFTPEMLKGVGAILRRICVKWSRDLGKYREPRDAA